VPGLGDRQVPHGVACARRGVQVDQRRLAGGLREAVRHPDCRALLQRQDIAEIIREVTQLSRLAPSLRPCLVSRHHNNW
jgi:hypothetical protein